MAVLTTTNTFLNGPDSVAVDVNQNFTDITTFLNASILQRDGSTVPTTDLGLGANRVSSVGAPLAPTDAVPRSEIDAFSVAGLWRRSTSQSVSYTGNIEMDTEVSDPLGLMTIGVDPGTWTIPSDGLYMFSFRYSNTSNLVCAIRVDNSVYPPGEIWQQNYGSTYWISGTSFIHCTTGQEIVWRPYTSTAQTFDNISMAILKVSG